MWRIALAIASALALFGCAASGSPTAAEVRAKAIEDGAVALCNDGNFSVNHDLTATCSGGDGIDEWLAEFGECEDGEIVLLEEDACGSSTDLKRLMPADYEPPSPEEARAKAIEDGAVALCNDGNFSVNHDLTATCSGGDGIDVWLAEFGECEDGEIVLLDEDACGYGNDLKRLMPPGYQPPTTTTTTTSSTTTTAAPTTTVVPVAPLAAPAPAPTAPPATAPPTTAPPVTSPPASTFYANCAAVRAAGAAPIYRGQPGYSSKLDRDGDGIGCE